MRKIRKLNSIENFYFKFFSEYPLEAVGRKAIDLYIDVFRSNSQKNVVHGTAHAAKKFKIEILDRVSGSEY